MRSIIPNIMIEQKLPAVLPRLERKLARPSRSGKPKAGSIPANR
jgi:hypothetical protein